MKSFITFWCVLASIAVHSVVVQGEDYCSLPCGKEHIGCNHRNDFGKRCPRDAELVPITPELRKHIVKLHNKNRNFIAGGNYGNYGKACRMAAIKWSDDLATLAVLNVYQCHMQHDRCHDTVTFETSGQNLYEKYNTAPFTFNDTSSFADGVEYWYNEKQYTSADIIKTYPENYSGPAIGHFTVMVTDRNTHVGCAAATYTKDDGLKYFLVACNYATTNILGAPVYTTCPTAGSSCSQQHPVFKNLCAKGEKYEDVSQIQQNSNNNNYNSGYQNYPNSQGYSQQNSNNYNSGPQNYPNSQGRSQQNWNNYNSGYQNYPNSQGYSGYQYYKK